MGCVLDGGMGGGGEMLIFGCAGLIVNGGVVVVLSVSLGVGVSGWSCVLVVGKFRGVVVGGTEASGWDTNEGISNIEGDTKGGDWLVFVEKIEV